jgi:hypothetical protein
VIFAHSCSFQAEAMGKDHVGDGSAGATRSIGAGLGARRRTIHQIVSASI